MGSQSSSGMSGRRSSGNPDQSEPDSNQNQATTPRSRRGTERTGQVRLVHGSGATGLQLVQSISDSDEDSDGAWEGRLGHRYDPPVDLHPDTQELDRSEIRTQILLATASSRLNKKHSFTHMLNQREQGRCHGSSFSHGECSRIRSHFLPNYVSQKDIYQQKAFCGVYSEDGNLFLSACQDQNIRLYDTSRGRLHLKRTVKARDVGWSVLDVCFTPDSRSVLYSSWSDYVHVCSIDGESETHTALDLNPEERRFCVFSLTASTDSREVLGGSVIDAHEDDVNAVAFADVSSQLLFSGSDDALCKVWDRRTLREHSPQPVGVLAGHRDGITFIHSKGDARYLISNSKDQTIKLWDVRKFSPKEGLAASRLAVTQQNWDYRWQQVPQRALKRHKLTGDTSVMTYRGHGVLHTLIRCRFSPEFSTGQKFIYSGCSTGKIIIYDVLTGQVVTRLTGHDACVRDVSWHPYQDNIISSSWDGAIRMWEHRHTHLLDKESERASEWRPEEKTEEK
ncbi:DDB1- and CUL4-associated factor 11 [Bagarius yarrelli]|uniref:DDB1- and CUL4-associated factor 11 n=1 Tax=Bagarius yarrelli TaxID=175774 RepID=A0A556TWD2_BAGYA|nr:DDB1- and CUL4-associated factor 11 [Bagarius yarrelli]